MGNFNGGMNELMRQAARMQRKIEQVKKEVGDKEVSATAVGDKVKATVTLSGKVSRIEIDPEFLKTEGLELGLDGACAANQRRARDRREGDGRRAREGDRRCEDPRHGLSVFLSTRCSTHRRSAARLASVAPAGCR